jgi:hypothetical protein
MTSSTFFILVVFCGRKKENMIDLIEVDTAAGLPDGLFANQKSQLGYILEGLRSENVDVFYGHMEYFTDIWNIL